MIMKATYSAKSSYTSEYTHAELCPKCGVDTFRHYANKYAIEKWCMTCRYFTFSWLDCCSNPEPRNVIYYMKDGRPSQRQQCQNCGKLVTGSAISFKGINQEKLPYFDESHEQNRNIEITKLKDDYVLKKRNNFPLRYKIRYLDYLKSTEWKTIRLKVMERDNFMCKKCGTEKACHVHHLTYERLRCERLDDLISICLCCHLKEHDKV